MMDFRDPQVEVKIINKPNKNFKLAHETVVEKLIYVRQKHAILADLVPPEHFMEFSARRWLKKFLTIWGFTLNSMTPVSFALPLQYFQHPDRFFFNEISSGKFFKYFLFKIIEDKKFYPRCPNRPW